MLQIKLDSYISNYSTCQHYVQDKIGLISTFACIVVDFYLWLYFIISSFTH
jgi:hypothetical protein